MNEIELPDPEGVDEHGPWWRTFEGARIYAVDRGVYTPDGYITASSVVEQDALAHLAAARWAPQTPRPASAGRGQ